MADSKKQVRPGGPHGRGHGYQRPQDLRGTVGKLLGYIGRYKGALIVVAVCLIYDINLVLGLDIKSMVLLGLSVFIVMLSLNQGRTNILYGVVLLVNMAAYIFNIIVP